MSLFPELDDDNDDTTLEDHPLEPAALMRLELLVRDRETLQALAEVPEGRPRSDFALDALRIGVLALRHANSRIDADLVKNASAELLENLQKTLAEHGEKTQERTAVVLKEYFDPASGRLPERLQRLVSEDGELARFFEVQLHGEGSPFAKRVEAMVGPLLRQLDPQQSEGLLATLRKTVDAELTKQQEQMKREFSLDNHEGALFKLVRELTSRHGDLSKDLQGKIDEVVKEFDLNKEDSALNRLVGNVERAQRTITSEFSLDNEHSSLTRLKRELLTILEAQVKTNVEFQEEVKITLARLSQKRDSDARSPEHGNLFEEAVAEFVMDFGQRSGDLADRTGASTGAVSRRKVGDVVVELGPESQGAGARYVVEAKDDGKYTVVKAREEIDLARKNRKADFGVFVFAQSSQAMTRPLVRYRNDVLVKWDPEDPATDAYLLAALEIAKACAVEFHRGTDTQEADWPSIDKAINSIEKSAQNLDKIRKPAETIRSSSETILERVRIEQASFERQLTQLREKLAALRTSGDGA
ncbi:hypothetical protein KOR34_40920 [Posidoniimonas corsicana]|uniref:Uncharacterized protein n=1 Tax=Posidoniimonas corsicana TaxID=1938618 RepID=A0A5C5V308_9BACT|nr:hypothetical protein [Posidoniimonas corsicana]TWT32329.1 hypothetical protein KOR34_40920 [Posidoniimonas corsicana]